ncbi:MAG: hypothetical protein DME93_06890 [Verrucomicrobia bacterium]|nr:MAG: hypothetical protein DME93_06890 [Verrucomicrobiota bacterium]
MSIAAYLLPAYRDELEKRRGDACALQSFAKHENALGQFRTQCFWSAMSPRIAFVFALGT